MNPFKNTIIAITTTLAFAACKKDKIDDPPFTNEQEVITSIYVTATDSADTSQRSTGFVRDPDGEGGAFPISQKLSLKPNRTYQVNVVLLDETKTPADTISKEVAKEAQAHQFFYSQWSNLLISYLDTDVNGKPLGLSTRWKTIGPGTGKIRIILTHYGTKEKTGLITDGDTDLEVDLDVEVAP